MEERHQKEEVQITLRQLLECVPDVAGMSLPTAKMLRENGEVLAVRGNDPCKLVVYSNGFFTYTDGTGVTVQGVSACQRAVKYFYLDGSRSELSKELFMDEPFEVRLMLEGERRLARNALLRNKGRVFSYDNIDLESADLQDTSDFVNEWIEAQEYEEKLQRLHRAIEDLKEKQKRILQLYYADGKTQQEIADMFGCKKQSISEIIARARKRIKKKFFQDVPDKPACKANKVEGNLKKKGRKVE